MWNSPEKGFVSMLLIFQLMTANENEGCNQLKIIWEFHKKRPPIGKAFKYYIGKN